MQDFQPHLPKLMCITAQSFRQKTLAIHDAVSDNKFDVAFFTETGFYSRGDEAYVAQMTPEVISRNHSHGKGKEGEG